MRAILTENIRFNHRNYNAGTIVEIVCSRPENDTLVGLVRFPEGEETWLTLPRWIREMTDADAPNPIVREMRASDGGTIRVYQNGMVDAVDGEIYSLSPGFCSVEDCEAWIRKQIRHNCP